MKKESGYISMEFHRIICKSRFNYTTFASAIGLKNKQAVYYHLSKSDEKWSYTDIEMFCKVLQISTERFLSDVDRKRAVGSLKNVGKG